MGHLNDLPLYTALFIRLYIRIIVWHVLILLRLLSDAIWFWLVIHINNEQRTLRMMLVSVWNYCLGLGWVTGFVRTQNAHTKQRYHSQNGNFGRFDEQLLNKCRFISNVPLLRLIDQHSTAYWHIFFDSWTCENWLLFFFVVSRLFGVVHGLFSQIPCHVRSFSTQI